MSSCGSNAGMETTVPVVIAIVNNALFHLHISKTPPQIIRILRFCQTRCPRFCNKLYRGHGCSMSRKLEVHMSVLRYCTIGFEAADDADTAREKDNDQQNPSKMIM